MRLPTSLVKIWDYHAKSCVQTLEGHTANVSFAIFHPSLPIILSGSEDGTVKIWHSSTYRLENTLNYGLERAWCVAYRKSGNEVAVGFDEGAVVVKLGRDEPAVSMDTSGKIVYARNTEILSANIANLGAEGTEIEDGQRLAVSLRDLGTTEVYPQSLQHSPNGRFVAVCGDGEYIIYTALAWRNRAFGSGISFAWAADSNSYAVLEGKSKVRVYKNFKERSGLVKSQGGWAIEGLQGGPLLSARGSGFVMFWDWETGAIVRRIEVDATNVSWSASGDLVAITAEDSFYILRFDRDAYATRLDSGEIIGDEGVEEAFDIVAEISEPVKTCRWVGDCFIYTTSSNRLSYVIGDQASVINHFDQGIYLLGYLPSHNRVYVADKDMNLYSYALSLTVVEYQTAVLRGDMEEAQRILPSIPADQRNRIARFLEVQDLKELALTVATDADHRFDLAIGINDLEAALDLLRAAPAEGAEAKWKVIGDKALAAWQLDLAQEAFEKSKDLPALLLLFTSLSDRAGLERVAELALAKGANNIAFAAFLQLGNSEACIDLLAKTDRLPEAALMARTYNPAKASGVVKQWRSELESQGRPKIAAVIADPVEDRDLFDEHGFSEGSGVMVDKEGESEGGGAAAAAPAGVAIVDGLADQVKEMAVSDGQQEEQEPEGISKIVETQESKPDDPTETDLIPNTTIPTADDASNIDEPQKEQEPTTAGDPTDVLAPAPTPSKKKGKKK
jgi:coatomer subunit beta'